MTFDTDWQAGSPLVTRSPDGYGTVLQSVPDRLLVYDWIHADQPETNGSSHMHLA